MKKIFKLTSENEVELRKELKSMGLDPQMVDALEYGCYIYDGVNIRKITETMYFARENTEAIMSGLLGGGTAAKAIMDSNAKLNTEKYKCRNEHGKKTGKGFAFEDLNNRAFQKDGYKVDSSIGKEDNWGGPDAIMTDKDGHVFRIQYKCYTNPTQAAKKIAERGGYPGQVIVSNPEITESLKIELKQMEAKGEVPKGTADRVISSSITQEESKRAATPFTKESLRFDARTASKTGIVVAFVAAGVALAYTAKKEGRISKKGVKKSIILGLGLGALAFLTHIGINQSKKV